MSSDLTSTGWISVTATKEGFRRAGRAWGLESQVLPVGDFTDEQLEELRAEPRVIVHAVAAPADEPEPAAGGEPAGGAEPKPAAKTPAAGAKKAPAK